MAKIIPFKGLRPQKELAAQVASLPYDVMSVAEAREYQPEPNSFLHVTRAEIDLPEGIDVHSAEVYEKAKENLEAMVAHKVLVADATPCYYIYELEMNGRSQTGLVCGSSVDDYNNGIVKRHELTRPEKELDRINHITVTGAQTGVVFLAYNDNQAIQDIMRNWKASHDATYNFTAGDGIRHTLWVVDDAIVTSDITRVFASEVPCTYIADGHHRAASAEKVCRAMQAQHPGADGSEPWNYFITCIFPASELYIMDYNRVVKDLGGMDTASFIVAIENDFEVASKKKEAVKPAKPHDFGMYIGGEWYLLTARPGTYTADPIGVLDVTVLQQNVLDKILGIKDQRTDPRIDFVGGIRGMAALEKRVDSGDAAAAFSLYPVTIQQLFDIADTGSTMPPKSTWFEPKLRDGLVVYTI